MPPQDGLGLHNKKRIAPISEPSTGANPELPVRIAQTRLRARALQHQQLLSQAQVLGNQQHLRLESRQNSPDEKVKHPSAQSRRSRRRGFAIVNNEARGRQFCALQLSFHSWTFLLTNEALEMSLINSIKSLYGLLNLRVRRTVND